MSRVERQPRFAAPALCLRFLFRNQLSPPPDAEEIFLDLPNDLHGLWRAVECSPSLLEKAHVNRTLVRDDLLEEQGGLRLQKNR